MLPYRVPEWAGQSLTPTGLFWTDETLLFLSHSTAAAFLVFWLAAAADAAAVRRSLQQALTLHAVPHAVAKVDQKAWEESRVELMCELEELVFLFIPWNSSVELLI